LFNADDPIYLDHNATTPVLPEVVDAMLPYLREHFGNPSSEHVYGRRARPAVDSARADVAGLLGCTAREVVFTSGGTESSNLAILGAAAARPDRRQLVTSIVEHPATSATCKQLTERGWQLHTLPVDADGCTSVAALRAQASNKTCLITLMHANNETGAVQPLAEAAAIAKHVGAWLHTDASQSAGKIAVDVDKLGVDLLTLAGHKIYAPKGVGALYIRRGLALGPILGGAGHEGGLRPGTENVAAIVGLGRACAIAALTLEEESAREQRLRDQLWHRLRAAIPGLRLHGPSDRRLPNTLNVGFPGVSGRAVLANTPEVAASTGSACHEGGERASAGLLAMGLHPKAALGAVRLTLGRSTTEDQVDQAAEALTRGWKIAAS